MQTLIGIVISTKTEQTVTVAVKRRFRHPIYKKSLNKTKKFHVHDTTGVQVGDMVKFVPCKPISKTKKWIVNEVVSGPSVSGSVKSESKEEVTKTTKKESTTRKSVKKTTK